MASQPKPPRCTCADTGACGFCPSIAATAYAQARPYTDPAWAGTVSLGDRVTSRGPGRRAGLSDRTTP